MFLNDLIIPKNFISLENYKTKTNPQTTKFCNQLCIDDPLALVMGQIGRTSLCQNEPELDSTFSTFMDSTLCSNNEDDSIVNNSPKLPISAFVLPEPKNDSTYTNIDESSFLNNSSHLIEPDISTEKSKNENSIGNNLLTIISIDIFANFMYYLTIVKKYFILFANFF